MSIDRLATINLKVPHTLRNRFLGKLRGRGITMQAFFVDIMALIDQDETLLDLLEDERTALRERRDLVQV